MILIELVPRDLPSFYHLIQTIGAYKSIAGVNIPDILSLPHRSYDIAYSLLRQGYAITPHVRCIDCDLDTTLSRVDRLVRVGLRDILIISGDNHPNQPRHPQASTSIQTIRALKQAYPALTVYAALDPYRQAYASEYAYCQAKRAAGCDGFFTQPFFDISMATRWLTALSDTRVYMGISPVITATSKRYWERVNRVVFTDTFQLDFDYNITLAQSLMALASQHQQHSYIMPIKLDILAYLTAVFASPEYLL